MKKTYIYPNIKAIDLKDNICNLMTGSPETPDGDDPNLGNGGGSSDNPDLGSTGGDAKAERGWASGW